MHLTAEQQAYHDANPHLWYNGGAYPTTTSYQ